MNFKSNKEKKIICKIQCILFKLFYISQVISYLYKMYKLYTQKRRSCFEAARNQILTTKVKNIKRVLYHKNHLKVNNQF